MPATRPARALLAALGLLAPAAAAPAGAAAGAPSPAAPAPSRTYTVVEGDSLGAIARRLGVALAELLSVNGLTLTSVIHPGDVLVLPGGLPGALTPVQTPAPAPSATYVVVPGDFLFGVAKALGVTVPALLAANGLTLASVIRPGQTLTVPDGGRLPLEPAAAPTPSAGTATPAAGAPAAPAATIPYTVLGGDHLSGIARKHGVTLGALLAANQLRATSTIFPGMVLHVPPATLPIPSATPAASAAPAAPATSAASAATAPIDVVLTFLRAQVGKPYRFNAAGPDAYDCSGLVVAAYDLVGIDLPHQSQLQSTRGTAVDVRSQPLLPGDLIFQFSSATPASIGHVGIVVDATHWIQAAGSGVPVAIGRIPPPSKIRAVRRILQP